MMAITHPNIRGEQVIRLLTIHGALSFGALRQILTPPITEKRLRDVLARLVKSGMIRRRLIHQDGGSASYYDIAEPHRSDLGLPTVHSFLLTHNDLCVLAVELLRKSFPEANYVREHDIPRTKEYRNVMKYENGTRDALPDMLMVIRPHANEGATYIAIEIERSTKSTKRLLKKFSKYGARTLLDGIIYLSEDLRVLSALTSRYQAGGAGRALRVRHYKDHFFLVAGCPTKRLFEVSNPRNSLDRPVSLISWIHTLATTPMAKRRDAAFPDSGGGSRIAE